jgi:glucose/arabinose dehydrogenase
VRFRRHDSFADKLVVPMGLAWSDGKLYACDLPEAVAFEDRGGKGGPRTVVLGQPPSS